LRRRRDRLATGQRNRRIPEAALGSDDNGLPVAARGQRQVRPQSWCGRDHLKVAVRSTTPKIAPEPAAAFAPGSLELATLSDHVAGEIESIAVAGAEQGEVESIAASPDRVSRPAADALGRTVVERDNSRAGPNTGHACEGARLRVSGGSENRRPKERDNADQQASYTCQKPARLAACVTAAKLPSARCRVSQRMPRSIFPIRHCR